MLIIKLSVLTILAVSISSLSVSAQKKTIKPTTQTKIKPPKLETMLSNLKDSASVTKEDAGRIIGMPLKIYDANKNPYSISSYQFLYKKNVQYQNESSDKVINSKSISSQLFKVSPLPQLWVNLIREDIKSGEEFYFFDIIAKDSQGRVMYAPDLKIIIK